MTVGEVMRTNFERVTPEVSICDAAARLANQDCAALVVVEASGNALGIFTYVDLLRLSLPGYTDEIADLSFLPGDFRFVDGEAPDLHALTVGQAMEVKPLHKITVDDPIVEAGRIMLANHRLYLPVLRGDALVGIVALSDIARALLNSGETSDAAQ